MGGGYYDGDVAERSRSHFVDGVWMIELAPVSDGAAVPGAIAAARRCAHQSAQSPDPRWTRRSPMQTRQTPPCSIQSPIASRVFAGCPSAIC